MLTALILILLVTPGLVLVLLGVIAVGIRHEQPWTELSYVAPSPVAVMVRRMCGLHVRRPTPTQASADQQEEGASDTPATRTRTTTSHQARGG